MKRDLFCVQRFICPDIVSVIAAFSAIVRYIYM